MPGYKYISGELESYHYSAEKQNGKRVLLHVTNPVKQAKIDAYRETHGMFEPNKTVEIGFSEFTVLGDDVTVNESFLAISHTSYERNVQIGDHTYQRNIKTTTVSRSENPLQLPISCVETTEHVVAVPKNTGDFIAHNKPEAKKQVYFQILIHENQSTLKKKQLLTTIVCTADKKLNDNDVIISYDDNKKCYLIEVATQKANIKAIIATLAENNLKLIDCDFDELKINEGICFVKLDGSNPIHARPIVGKLGNDIICIEREAGSLPAISYQATNKLWLFKPFNTLYQGTDFDENKTCVLKIVKHGQS